MDRLEFKASDFCIETKLATARFISPGEAAAIAQATLDAWLEARPTILVTVSNGRSQAMVWTKDGPPPASFSARLVAIEPLPEK